MMNFNLNFNTLFKVQLNHSYFEDNQVRRVSLSLAEESLFICKRIGLDITLEEDNILFQYKASDQELVLANLLKYIKNKISITAYAKDVLFYNYTEISTEKGLPTIYCSNIDAEASDNGDFKIKPEDKNILAIKNQIKYPTKEAPYVINIEKSGYGKQVESWTESVAEGKDTIDFSSYGSGKYTVHNEDKSTEQFCVIPKNKSIHKPVLFIELFLEEIYNKIKTIKTKSLSYTINFKVRKTFWRYIIVWRGDQNYSSFVISTNHENIKFKTLKTKYEKIKYKHSVLQSIEPVPYNQTSQLEFKLRSSAGEKVKEALDFPSPKSMGFDENKNKISEIIVLL